MENIVKNENLKAVGRNKPPTNKEDFNYFINQLVQCGKISKYEADQLYIEIDYFRN